jgi:hypothetical protein
MNGYALWSIIPRIYPSPTSRYEVVVSILEKI